MACVRSSLRHARPWLLVGVVILIALFIALVIGWHPPDEGRPGWSRQGFTIETATPMLGSITTSQLDPPPMVTWDNLQPNITRVHIRTDVEATEARGEGRIWFKVEVRTPGASTASSRHMVYDCTGPAPVAGLQCPPVTSQAKIDIAEWRLSSPPAPVTRSSDESVPWDPPPRDMTHVGEWSFLLHVETQGEAELRRAGLNPHLTYEYYTLAKEDANAGQG